MFKSTIKDVAQFFNVNGKTVKNWVDLKMLKPGEHYLDVRTPHSKKSCLRFNLDACVSYFLNHN